MSTLYQEILLHVRLVPLTLWATLVAVPYHMGMAYALAATNWPAGTPSGPVKWAPVTFWALLFAAMALVSALGLYFPRLRNYVWVGIWLMSLLWVGSWWSVVFTGEIVGGTAVVAYMLPFVASSTYLAALLPEA